MKRIDTRLGKGGSFGDCETPSGTYAPASLPSAARRQLPTREKVWRGCSRKRRRRRRQRESVCLLVRPEVRKQRFCPEAQLVDRCASPETYEAVITYQIAARQ